MKTYIDIGINLTNKQFQNDIDDVVQNALDADVSQMILTGTSVRNSEESSRIAKEYPGILYATAGIHPHDAKSFDAQSISKLRNLLKQKQVVSVGFLVRGKGEENAINSASHGAGRQMSRTQAIKNITKNEMKSILQHHGVTLIGAGLDEAPMAYKDINQVMEAQQDLVDVVAKFTPKLVRMADDGSRED